MTVSPFDVKTVLLARHAQHVVLIHFPIALFTAAVAFDFLAQWTKNRGLAAAVYFVASFSELRHQLTIGGAALGEDCGARLA